MNNKIIQLLMFFGFLSSAARCQQDITMYRRPLATFHIIAGGQVFNFSGLNGQLQKAGMDKLNPAMSQIGVGLAFSLRRITAAIDASFMTGYQKDQKATGTNARIYFFTSVAGSKNWSFGPEIGIDWQAVEVQVTQPSSAGSFNNALTATQNQIGLQHNNTMMDLALAYKIRSSRRSLFAPSPAFKFGYRYGLGNNRWEVRRSFINDGPKDRVSNFYLDLVLTFSK